MKKPENCILFGVAFQCRMKKNPPPAPSPARPLRKESRIFTSQCVEHTFTSPADFRGKNTNKTKQIWMVDYKIVNFPSVSKQVN